MAALHTQRLKSLSVYDREPVVSYWAEQNSVASSADSKGRAARNIHFSLQ